MLEFEWLLVCQLSRNDYTTLGSCFCALEERSSSSTTLFSCYNGPKNNLGQCKQRISLVDPLPQT